MIVTALTAIVGMCILSFGVGAGRQDHWTGTADGTGPGQAQAALGILMLIAALMVGAMAALGAPIP